MYKQLPNTQYNAIVRYNTKNDQIYLIFTRLGALIVWLNDDDSVRKTIKNQTEIFQKERLKRRLTDEL